MTAIKDLTAELLAADISDLTEVLIGIDNVASTVNASQKWKLSQVKAWLDTLYKELGRNIQRTGGGIPAGTAPSATEWPSPPDKAVARVEYWENATCVREESWLFTMSMWSLVGTILPPTRKPRTKTVNQFQLAAGVSDVEVLTDGSIVPRLGFYDNTTLELVGNQSSNVDKANVWCVGKSGATYDIRSIANTQSDGFTLTGKSYTNSQFYWLQADGTAGATIPASGALIRLWQVDPTDGEVVEMLFHKYVSLATPATPREIYRSELYALLQIPAGTTLELNAATPTYTAWLDVAGTYTHSLGTSSGNFEARYNAAPGSPRTAPRRSCLPAT